MTLFSGNTLIPDEELPFPVLVRKIRQLNNWTQAECCRRIGVSQPTWSQYENEASERYEYDTIVSIADALRVDPKWLMEKAGIDLQKDLRIRIERHEEGRVTIVDNPNDEEAAVLESVLERLRDAERVMSDLLRRRKKTA